MTTKEIADKLVTHCRNESWEACYAELYSPAVQSIEMDGTTATGFDEIMKKGEEWSAGVEEFKETTVGEPIVAGNFISLPMTMNLKFKGAPEFTKFEEMCVYQVKDGKIIKEQFFYDQM